MIQAQTILTVTDNSGIKKVKCIKIIGGFKKRYGKFGSMIRCSVQELKKRNKKVIFKKGDLIFALIIQSVFQFKRQDGQRIKFFKNSVIIIDKQKKPSASRILSPICNELKLKNIKLLSLAETLL